MIVKHTDSLSRRRSPKVAVGCGIWLAVLVVTGCVVAGGKRSGRPSFVLRDGKAELSFGGDSQGLGIKFREDSARLGQMYLSGGGSGSLIRWGAEESVFTPMPCVMDVVGDKGRILVGRSTVLCEKGKVGVELPGFDERGEGGVSVILRSKSAGLRIGDIIIASTSIEDKLSLGERRGLYGTKPPKDKRRSGLVMPRALIACVNQDVGFGVYQVAWDKVTAQDLIFLTQLGGEVMRSF